MAEGWNPSTGFAWGCTPPVGWVPYPQEIPRRHPLLDAVGRIDDPCARPSYNAPEYNPTPKFKPPREGYPNNLCNLSQYKHDGPEAVNDQVLANINVASGTQQAISLQVQPCSNVCTVRTEPPSVEDCCKDARELDTLKAKVNEVIGPHEEIEVGMRKWAQCQSVCQPRIPAYPCKGVISCPSRGWLDLDEKIKAASAASMNSSEDDNPLTGREFTEGKRTCDLYPIAENLPNRFNNPEWFKGYGCEKPAHPFYLTTGVDYGRFPPTAHTMTQVFFPRNNKFTSHLGKTGMFRNRSLNLASGHNYC
ncbi:unnamed protein product [Allacma fusca]|uniref:Uncharacterized protein n=1 Tax=Allacma fusca TaxID=39272 RepID=A0A8J2LEN5_9HEXA|nr:unnamed protein product [Allacma fusca]